MDSASIFGWIHFYYRCRRRLQLMLLSLRLIFRILHISHLGLYRADDAARNNRLSHIVVHAHFVTLINVVLVVEQGCDDDNHLDRKSVV